MAGPPITLSAALRDAALPPSRGRDLAIRHMADALLHELDGGPRWRAADRHPRGGEVLTALRGALDDDASPVLQGFAAIGLGMLGDVASLPALRDRVDAGGDGQEPTFRRECAVIALAELAAAAAGDPGAAALVPTIAAPIAAGLESSRPEVRFQCASALVDVLGDDAEGPLVDALGREGDPEVRRALLQALSRLDHPGEAALERLRALVGDPGLDREAAFAAALALTAARDPAGATILEAALRRPEHRDRALEALAALGAAATGSLPAIRRLSRGLFTPRITRVRAAYALARIAPSEGLPLLERMGRSRWPGVREAVDEARVALQRLDAAG